MDQGKELLRLYHKTLLSGWGQTLEHRWDTFVRCWEASWLIGAAPRLHGHFGVTRSG